MICACTTITGTNSRSVCALAKSKGCPDIFLLSATLCLTVWCQLDRHGDGTQWQVGDKPRGIAVTAEGYLLVTCSVRRQLRLFTDEGVLIRDFELPDDITCPWHAVPLPVQHQLLVFHASTTDAGYQLSVCSVASKCDRK